jgi:hypothetical protein
MRTVIRLSNLQSVQRSLHLRTQTVNLRCFSFQAFCKACCVYTLPCMLLLRCMHTYCAVHYLCLQETEVNALLMKKMNFNSDEEAVLVKQVYTNALESLADEDRTLPQVMNTIATAYLYCPLCAILHCSILVYCVLIRFYTFTACLYRALFVNHLYTRTLYCARANLHCSILLHCVWTKGYVSCLSAACAICT